MLLFRIIGIIKILICFFSDFDAVNLKRVVDIVEDFSVFSKAFNYT